MPPVPHRMNLPVIAVLALVVLASRVLLLYSSGSPEPDSLAMVAGMTMALRGNVPLSEAFLYGREGSPGIYLVGRFVYPLFFRDPSHLLAFLTWATVLASVAMVWPALGIARRFVKPGVASAAVLIALLTPAVWELSTYFHPEILAATLLLFAIYAACSVDRSRVPAMRMGAAMLLGAGALLFRFHVLFVVPGLLVAALLSRHRLRNIVALTGALVLGAAAYAAVQGAVAAQGSRASTGFAGYVSMIGGMYAHSFSLRGLTRSLVWAGFGMGVISVAALAVCWWPWRTLRLEPRALKRGVTVGVVWALPPLLFWLPQPTPILRHYVLPALGIVLAVASGVLAMGSRRALVLLTGLMVVGNVALPEIAYRAYNARHPDGAKTPHGAVFYTHRVMQARIARFDGLADAVVRATSSPDSVGCIVFAQWEGYAHVIYLLARANPGLHPTSTSSFFESVQERRYEADGHEFRFVYYGYFEDPELKRRGVELIRECAEEGTVVLLPRELASGPLAGMLTEVAVSVY